MNGRQRALRRLQIDKRAEAIAELVAGPVPPGGWLRNIREALGMSLGQFAARMGLASASTAHQLEVAEVAGSITLKRLRAAADALECDVVVTVVPRRPLSQIAEGQARRKALERLSRTNHSMELEKQGVRDAEASLLVEQAVRELLDGVGSRLWE